MIAHVAEASEQSGRVVMWLDPSSRCSAENFSAPIHLAAAYGAEVETVAIDFDDEDGAADVPIRHVRRADLEALNGVPSGDDRFTLLTTRQRRAIEKAAEASNVAVKHAWARGGAIDRLSEMCLARGPWNILALPQLPNSDGQDMIGALLANISGATALMVCGKRSLDAEPRTVVLVEDAERLPSMLRMAERLTADAGSIHFLVVGETATECSELDEQARLLTADHQRLVFAPSAPTFGVPGALIAVLAPMRPSFIIGRFGGSGIADGRELARTLAATQASILLVR